MKENTFDIPAYKFFAMKINDGRVSHTSDHYNFLITNNYMDNSILIPFENIDGLDVEEMRTLLQTDEIVILGTTHYEGKCSDDPLYVLDNTGILYFPREYLDERKNMSIDKICEEYMEEDYMNNNEPMKRMYRCFFERYQDGSYEKTKERIKKLEMRK